jgi:hypothetical protein
MKIILLPSLILFSFLINAENYKNPLDFCEHINIEIKKKSSVIDHRLVISQFAIPLIAKKDCSLIKKSKSHSHSILIDTRDKTTKKMSGIFPGVMKINPDQWDNKTLLKKTQSYFKRKGKKIKGISDLLKINYYIFDNGLKDYDSLKAACYLNKLGVDKARIYLILDGHIGLKKNCFK